MSSDPHPAGQGVPTECVGCKNIYKSPHPSIPPADGWLLPVNLFGYYGGFTDTELSQEGDDRFLCHDCVVNLLTHFPGLTPPKGGHRNLREPDDFDSDPLEWNPCCDWAWAVDDRGFSIRWYHADGGQWYEHQGDPGGSPVE